MRIGGGGGGREETTGVKGWAKEIRVDVGVSLSKTRKRILVIVH